MADLTRTIHFPDQREPEDSASPRLIVLEGARAGQIVDLVSDTTSIGRLPDNNLCLDSPSVSKKHALIVREGCDFFVEDVGSMNGVYVNGTRLDREARRRLFHGDNLRITDSLIVFRAGGCFTAADGASAIVLDHQKIKAEAADFLEAMSDARSAGG
jgi:pSer/pThr/pTyr-binding forkhead associated (FHA) protein